MLTPEEKAAGKVEWKDIPLGSYIDMRGFSEDELPTVVDKIPQELEVAASVAFVIGCIMGLLVKYFHWFLYIAFAGLGAAVGLDCVAHGR